MTGVGLVVPCLNACPLCDCGNVQSNNTGVANCTALTEPVHLFGEEIPLTTASYIVSACDGLSALVVLVVFGILSMRIRRDESHYQTKHLQIQKYTGARVQTACIV